MIALALGLAVAATWLVAVPGVRPGRLDATPGADAHRRGLRVPTLAAFTGLGVLAGGAVVAGHRGVVVAAVCCLVGGTALAVGMHRLRQRRARETRAAVGQACAALASLVAAGRVPSEALRDVAADWDVLAEGADTVALGGDPTEAWLRAADRPGCAGLAELARGWTISTVTGAPLVGLLDVVSASLSADAEIRHTVESELASSRATGRLLAALPLIGLLLGFGFGGNPVSFLLDHPVGWGCSVGGAALACVGVGWNERIVDKAEAW